MTAHLIFFLIVNLLMIILAITGFYLDRKKKLIYEPKQDQQSVTEANPTKPHKPVAIVDASIFGTSLNVTPHETEMHEVQSAPLDQEDAKPVSTNQIQLQLNNVNENSGTN